MATRTTRYTDAQKAEALRLYREGASCQAVAKKMVIPQSTIRWWVGKAGLMRPKFSYTDAQKAEALRLYRRGYSCRAAAQETGVGFRVVAKWARAAGIIRKRSLRSAHQIRRSKTAHRELLRQIRALRRRGLTLREIGERFGRSRQTIARWLRE